MHDIANGGIVYQGVAQVLDDMGNPLLLPHQWSKMVSQFSLLLVSLFRPVLPLFLTLE